MKKQKGQLTIGIGIALSIGTLLASGLVGFFSSSLTVNEKISQDRQRLSALETDNENLEQWLSRIESKLDQVISRK